MGAEGFAGQVLKMPACWLDWELLLLLAGAAGLSSLGGGGGTPSRESRLERVLLVDSCKCVCIRGSGLGPGLRGGGS